jgi:hypothetical protein
VRIEQVFRTKNAHLDRKKYMGYNLSILRVISNAALDPERFTSTLSAN